jgi:TRAP-type C4-dicarboxylate transport system permease small subunit
MVFLRYVLNQNTIWQTDFVTWSLVAATFVGSPYVLLTRGHVNVDVLPLHLGARARWWLALASIIMSLAFCVVLLFLAGRFWLESWEQRWVSDTMWRARMWIPYSSMPVGLGILALQFIADLLSLLSGREPPFGIRDTA